MNLCPKKKVVFFVLFILLFLSLILGVMIGSVSIPIEEQGSILWDFIRSGAKTPETTQGYILLYLRLPRGVLGALVGFALALCGATMQGIFRNPLADPYLLGISSGATAGAATVICAGITTLPFALPAGAFLGGIVAVAIVYAIAQSRFGSLSNHVLLLAGIAVSSLFSAVASFMVLVSDQGQLRQVVFWAMGSLAVADWPSILNLSIAVSAGALGVFLFTNHLDALSLGDDMARHLGIDPGMAKKTLLLIATFLTASVVCVSGTIAFVGLIVPHVMRIIVGPKHRGLLIASGMAGALFLMICDILARSILSPMEIPVGIVTSFFGAPFFLYLLLYHKKKSTP